MKEPNRVAVFVIFMGMHVHLISLQVVQDVADVLLIAQVTQVIVTLLTALVAREETYCKAISVLNRISTII